MGIWDYRKVGPKMTIGKLLEMLIAGHFKQDKISIAEEIVEALKKGTRKVDEFEIFRQGHPQRATAYRVLAALIRIGLIERKQRGRIILSDRFRKSARNLNTWFSRWERAQMGQAKLKDAPTK